MAHHQLSCVDGGPITAVPAARSFSPRLLEGLDSALNMVSLLLARQAPVFFPTPPVPQQVVPRFSGDLSDRRVAFERHGTGEEGGFYLVLFEESEQAPYTHTAAILIHQL